MSWSIVLTDIYNNLPESLQETTLYYIIGVCWAAGYFCRLLPAKHATPFVRQWAVLCVGMEAALYCVSPPARALGMGLIYSSLSMASYDLGLRAIETLVKYLFAMFMTFTTIAFRAKPPIVKKKHKKKS